MNLDIQVNAQQLEALVQTLGRANAGAQTLAGSLNRISGSNLRGASGDVNRLTDALRDAQSQTRTLTSLTTALKGALGGLAVGAAFTALAKGVIEAQREFDKFNAALITATGSSENAKQAMGALQEFAKETPYSLEQAVEGFVKLRNMGLDPSEKALKAYGNTAAAMGKDLNQMVEAVADATTGEFERLKEFGIKASQNGDQVALTFKGMTTTIGNNAKEIEQYLISLGENDFAGAMELRANTLDGAIGQLGETWKQTQQVIADTGPGELAKEGVLALSGALDDLQAILKVATGEMDASGKKADEVSGLHFALTTTFEALAVLGINVAYVFKQVGREIGGIAAQATALANFDWEGVKRIGKMMREDADRDRKDVDKRSEDILNAAANARKEAERRRNEKKETGRDDLAGYRTTLTPAQEQAAAEAKLMELRKKSTGVNNDYFTSIKILEEGLRTGALTQAQYVKEMEALAKSTYESSTTGKAAAEAQKKSEAEAKKTAAEQRRLAEENFRAAMSQYRDHLQEEQSAAQYRMEILDGEMQKGYYDQRDYLSRVASLQRDEINANIKHTDDAIAIARARGDKGKEELQRLLGDRKQYESELQLVNAQSITDMVVYNNKVKQLKDSLELNLSRRNSEMGRNISNSNAGIRRTSQSISDADGAYSITNEYANMRADKTREMTDQKFDKGAIADAMQIINDAESKATKIYQEGLEERTRMQANWKNGAMKAWDEYAEKAANVAEQTNQMFANAFQTMEDGLVKFVMTGKLEWKDMATSIIADIVRIQIKQAILNSMKMVQGSGWFSSMFAAEGAVHMAGGGIVNGPRYMAGGGAYIGEGGAAGAGPEAVMPLTRMKNGSLGVMAEGQGGGASVINNYVSVNVEGGKTNEETGDKTAAATIKAMEQVAKRQLVVQQRPGGSLRPFATKGY